MLTLRYPGDVIHIHVSYVPAPEHLGEPKQSQRNFPSVLSILWEFSPIFIVARSNTYIDQRRRDRFALFCNVPGRILYLIRL